MKINFKVNVSYQNKILKKLHTNKQFSSKIISDPNKSYARGKIFYNDSCISKLNFSKFTKKSYVEINQEKVDYSEIIKLMFENNILKKKLPCFEVYSSQIEILNSPFDFYLAIIKLIKAAKYRICISSLYLGTGKMEEFIIEELLKALRKLPDLKITILLDYSRSTRIENGKTSLDLVKRIISETFPHSRNIKIALFYNPNSKSIFNNISPTINEVLGVLHSKLIISDNNTIITGANLSHNYFTNRQDRYFIIQDCEPFADYCEDYIKSLVNVSHQVDFSGNLFIPQSVVDPIKSRVNYVNSVLQQFKMFKYENRVKIPSGEKLEMNEYFENLEKFNNNYRYRESTETFLDFNSNKKEFLKLLIEENNHIDKDLKFLTDMTKDQEKQENNENTEQISDRKVPMIKPSMTQRVLIFPSFQFKNISQIDDKDIITKLLSSDYISRVRISSGYLNITDFILNILRNKDYAIQMVTSSPRANSFYKSGLIKKHIPHFYRRYEELILKAMQNKTHKCDDYFKKSSFSLFEFQRENWSFHSKGIWLYEKDKKYPTMTVIGSSNFSKLTILLKLFTLNQFNLNINFIDSRSFERDVESQFYIYSFCDKFSKKLHNESEDCFNDSRLVSLNDIKSDRDVKIKLRHKLFAKLLKSFL